MVEVNAKGTSALLGGVKCKEKKNLVKNFSVFGKLQQVQCDLRGAAKDGLGMRREASLEGKHGLGRRYSWDAGE